MMSRPMIVISTLRAVLGCALAAVFLIASAPARAADDDDSVPTDTKVVRGILESLGLQRDGAAIINYQERPPLVIPSGKDLPPPEQGDAASKNPEWPKDPDVARRKAEAARNKNRIITDEREREQNPLPPSQMTVGGVKAAATHKDDGYRTPDNGYDSQIKPSELGYKGNLLSGMFGSKDEAEVGRFTKEPPRASLTDPPPGYQTPSPTQPYGLGKAAPAKPEDYYTTHGELSH
jgi:hypothetical protein